MAAAVAMSAAFAQRNLHQIGPRGTRAAITEGAIPGRKPPVSVMSMSSTGLYPACSQEVTILVTARRNFCHPMRQIMTIDIYLSGSR